jgi:hypothetical protein
LHLVTDRLSAAIGGKADIARTVVKRGGCTSSRIAYRQRPAQQLVQLGEVCCHPPRAVLTQSLGGGAPGSAKLLINVSPMRSQLAAVSVIRILLVGVERLILAPQFPQGIASFRIKTVTIFSVCCPHLWQRIRSIVQSAVEKSIYQARRGTTQFSIAKTVL